MIHDILAPRETAERDEAAPDVEWLLPEIPGAGETA